MPPKVTPKKDGPQQQPDLTAILAQLTAYLENQSKTQEALLEQLSKPKDNEFLMETLSNTIPEFVYDPQGGLVFDKWYSRHEEAFNKGGEKLEEADKVRLLVRKLSSVDHDRYVNYILPENPPDRSFQDTVDTLKEMFGHQTSVFFRRYQCLQTTKRNAEDFVTYASTVNRACEDFNIRTITSDQFKCLVFVAGLQSERYKDIRTRLLAKMEGETAEHPMTLKKLLLECQHLDNLKHDTAVIEGPKPAVKAVQQDRSGFRESGKPERKFDNRNPAKATPRRPCWQCGQMHFVADCSYTKHTCKTCGKVGHKEGYCACCSKPSGSGESASHTAPGGGKKKHKKKRADGGGHSNGVYAVNKEGVVGRRKFVEVLINNEPIELQLDCGSDYTIISTDSLPLLGNPETIPTELRVATASGKPLPLELEFECDVTFRGTTKRSVCYVTPVRGFKVLGSDLMEAFGQRVMFKENPVCKLTPIFKDYEKYLDEIEAKKSSGKVDTKEASAAKPAATASSGFTFGSVAPATTTTPAAAPTPAAAKPFSFGFGATSSAPGTGFSFANVAKPAEDAKPDEKATADDDEDEPPKVEFTPVEEKDSIFSKRCKLFVKADGNYSDRGIGTLHIKKVDGKVQVLVRADTSLGQIMLNIILNEAVPVQRMGKNNVMMVCVPTPETKPPPTSVLLRVKTGEEADELYETLIKHKPK